MSVGLSEDKITISDIAERLNVSKSTVSRAISGKGRISKATRDRILAYIEECNYTPNLIARSLKSAKTYNIGLVIPEETQSAKLPFFQRCLMGVCEMAVKSGYDVVVTMINDNSIDNLKRMILNQKVDGVILTRSLVKDEDVIFLKQRHIPFVLVGTSDDESVCQVDYDNREACQRIIWYAGMNLLNRIGIIGGDTRHRITTDRYEGYLQGLNKIKSVPDKKIIFLDVTKAETIEKAVETMVAEGVDCIACMDDFICACVLKKLLELRIKVPEQIKVVSFYYSDLLEPYNPSISYVKSEALDMGRKACELLIRMLEGQEVDKKNTLGYEVVLRQNAI